MLLCVNEEPPLHECFQDVLGSGQIFWNNGQTQSCTHSLVSLCISLSLSFIPTHGKHLSYFHLISTFRVSMVVCLIIAHPQYSRLDVNIL